MNHDPELAAFIRPLVFIVDDDRLVHAIASKILETFTGTLIHCHDGAEALEMAKRLYPDLIITDALMPRLDGRELARALKRSPDTCATKIAIMTGVYKGPRYRAEALRDFLVDDYIEKPINAAKLQRLVATVQPRLRAAV